MTKKQLDVVNKGLIDLNSYSPSQFQSFSGGALETALFNIAAEFVKNASDNLNKVDRISSGALQDSIIPGEIVIMGTKLELQINVLDYYKFIDKGVKGWKSGSPSDSPYSFKKPEGKSGAKNSEMVTAIRKWLISEGLKSRTTPKKSITQRESKRKSITDASTKAAIIVAAAIKRKGLKKTNFWTDSEKQTQIYTEQTLGEAVKIQIINSI
jgi:hypothetical protein